MLADTAFPLFFILEGQSMNVGVIGYGSMGKMILQKFAESGIIKCEELFISNKEKSEILFAMKFLAGYNVSMRMFEI